MVTIGKYGNRIEAEFDHARLESAGIASLVLGLGVAMEGGMQGIQLQVADEDVEAAREILRHEGGED